MSGCFLCAHPVPHPPERVSEGHVAVRFGDRDFRVELDGEDVSYSAFEALADPVGWVKLYPAPKRRCETNRLHAYAELRTGAVTVSRTGPLR